MATVKSKFLTTCMERGFFHQCTDLDALDALLVQKEAKGEPLVAYIGFDCTAKSFHVGNLMQIMMLHLLQRAGHKPIVLMGGGTTKVGDPSGKDEARRMLTDEDINANMASLKNIFKQYLTFEDKFDAKTTHAVMVNNDDWLSGLKYIEFLRDYGRHFSVNRMLSMDSVKLRLEREQNLSFLEFNYMILQGYDFVELNKQYACRLQIGGSDQWGNIVNGTELQRRIVVERHSGEGRNLAEQDPGLRRDDEAVHGYTTPLITTSSGAKMGKTAAGAVWLNADMLSPYDYWQYWRNTEDADVGRFLKFFTDMPVAEIAAIEAGNINDAKKILATEATKLCHGEKAALDAAETARKVFEEGGLSTGLPEITVPAAALTDGSLNPRALLVQAGLAESSGEAKKLIAGGGVKINDQTMSDANLVVTEAHFKEGVLKLSKGKKHHVLVKIG